MNTHASQSASSSSYDEAIQAALVVMDAHLTALNKRDSDGLAATLHFPHYRLSEGKVKVWADKTDYFSDFRKRAGSDWGYTAWEELTTLRASSDKVHLDVLVARFRPDDTPLTRFRSLWVISRVNGLWAAQFRSSFASDSEFLRTEPSQ